MKKVIITATLAATLLGTSVSAYAFSNKNVNPQEKPSIETKVSAYSDITKDPDNKAGKIEYTKTASLRDDGSEGLIFESWMDPNTLNSRMDNISKNDGKVNFYTSSYTKDKGRSIITLQRDSNGNATSGDYIPVDEKGAEYNNSLYSKNNSFTAIRAQYASSEWTSEGNITQDGITLKEVSKSFMGLEKKPALDKSQAYSKVQMKQVAYLDENTGLPTRIETYILKNDKFELQDTTLYEFKYIESAGNLFDTSGVKLNQLPEYKYDANAVG
ncbi:hypothetical protein [Clostridium sp. 'White wine YQ']|uniref:hypothetical protein n=1 Tax=Clostridium sp. 'White wine YQ' TaxID=3027474 RepID=UPI00236690AC|nr:hypothetical protein [Clostridium sp. 'White wine YQ']MDD7793589.1 hypothetical protein [Clostridium sp. 'White wine YQ']